MTGILRDKRLPVWLLAAASVLAIPLLFHWARDIGITRDEWQFMFDRSSISVNGLLTAFNGHLMPFTQILLVVNSAIFGHTNRVGLNVVAFSIHLSIVWLVFWYARSRVGDWLAAALGLLILFFGSGYELIIWAFNSGWIFSLAAGIAAIIVFEQPDSTRNRVITAVLLALSFSGNNNGLIFALAIAVRVLYKADRRRTLAVLAAPFGLWILWFLIKGGGSPHPAYSAVPDFLKNIIVATMGGLIGDPGGNGWGAPLAVLVLGGMCWRLCLEKTIRPQLATALTLPVVCIGLIAVGRVGVDPFASRYRYTLLVLLALAVSELFRGTRLKGTGSWLVLVALLALSIGSNLPRMADGAAGIRSGAFVDREYATALLRVGPVVAHHVKTNNSDQLLLAGDAGRLYDWLQTGDHREVALTPAEVAAGGPAIAAQIDAIAAQLRAEAAQNAAAANAGSRALADQ